MVVGLWLWFFGKALFSDESFVYRDAAHYYYPLFEWIDREWSAGRVPLWNPQDNCGVPVVADATSSVFYPGKLLFLLPLRFALRYKLYIALHSLLAAAGAYWLARVHKASLVAAAACAVAYAFCGNVLIQYCNVVFLVGAAWLPVAMVASHRALTNRSVVGAFVLAAVLALMTLGGDPQTAYHAGLLAALYALILWRSDRRAVHNDGESENGPLTAKPHWWRRVLGNRLVLLAIAAGGCASLAAVQILPSAEWARYSDRAVFDSPRSVYELPESFARGGGGRWSAASRGLLGQPPSGTHDADIYDFSVSPWRAAEVAFPNFSGKSFPENRRWTMAIPAEDRTWTPSLYMGLLPLFAALGSWRLIGGTAVQRWASWAALLAVLGSLGWYGAGWLIHEARCGWFGADPNKPWVGGPVGGLYWLMVVLLPGYVYFRYPAKLLIVAALAFSLLAAFGWDRLVAGKSRKMTFAVAAFALLSMVLALVFLTLRPVFVEMVSRAPADSYFGPLNAVGAANDLFCSFVHAAIVAVALLLLFLFCSKNKRALVVLALLVTCVDLAVAHRWMVPTAPDRIWTESSPLAKRIQADDDAGDSRVFRSVGYPREWGRESSPERQVESLQWDHDTMFPRYHLQTRLAYVEAAATIRSFEYQTYLNALRSTPPDADNNRDIAPHPLSVVSAKYFLRPEGASHGDLEPMKITTSGGRPLVPDVSLWRNPSSFPRAWIVSDVEILPEIDRRDPAAVRRRTKRIAFKNGKPRDFKKSAVVETDIRLGIKPANQRRQRDADPKCRIVLNQPQRIVIEAEMAESGLVVLNDLHDPGWTATISSRTKSSSKELRILRTNRIMRGVYVSAGKHRITLRYRPTSFYIGAVVSLSAWLILVSLAVFCVVRVLIARRMKKPAFE